MFSRTYTIAILAHMRGLSDLRFQRRAATIHAMTSTGLLLHLIRMQ